MKKQKICVVTGSRAEYGLLYWLMRSIEKDSKFKLQIIVTGMHLSPEFGLTYKEIEKDGFHIDKKVAMLLSADTPSAISKSMGLAMIGFGDSLEELQPDLLLLLGDRYEIFAAAISAHHAVIPIAHVSGGETTIGACDESLRHSITKMSWLHFVAAEEYEKRVIQLGENPKRVFNVGGMGVGLIKKTTLLKKNQLMENTGIKFGKRNLLITYHSVTLEKRTSQPHFQSLLNVLSDLEDIYLIFTMSNSDSDGRIINQMIDKFVSIHRRRSISFVSMGYLKYLSTLQFVDGVVGNSSSGLTEATTFKIGTVNIGDRQRGRLQAESVINSEPTEKSIKQAIETLYSQSFQQALPSVINPYGQGNSTEKIMDVLRSNSIPKEPKKIFFDL
jgi:GDP/UDP-N,N'-diacetylbacillosamine 2-epimerase (hydrolysing)